MKKVFFIAASIMMLASCSTIKHPYTIYSNVVDLAEFTKQGFFITESNSVSFDYDPVGSIQTTVKSGHEILKHGKVKEKMKDDVYSYDELGKIKFGEFIPASTDDAVAELVSVAKNLGANGIINLSFNYIPGDYGKAGELISPATYIVSGMAIKYL